MVCFPPQKFSKAKTNTKTQNRTKLGKCCLMYRINEMRCWICILTNAKEATVYLEIIMVHSHVLIIWYIQSSIGFPHSLVGKESTCNAGDPGSVPGLGRSPGEGIGYLLQYWASLPAQLVKNPPAMRETWVQSLGWEDPLEKGKVTHSSILAWRIP